MTPIFFDGRFGWLHEPATTAAPRPEKPVGVVLCAAFAQEEVCSHHGLMLLADRLADAGLPTIRFDYRGTGDSSDVEVSLATMQEDVERAADCLRARCGVGAIALCGLRLGAAVAAAAAVRIDGVAALAMLAPVIAGRAFLRETRAAASVSSLALLDPVPKPEAGSPLNTNGFLWSGILQREIAALDVSALPLAVPQLLLATTRSDRQAAALAETLRGRGVAVTERAFADYESYMQDPTTHCAPAATFAAATQWLTDLAGRGGEGPSPAAPVEIRATLAGDGWEETPQHFGPDDRVFGLLCRPVGRPAAPVAALLLHEGSSHHIGNGRAYVALARQLARAGIASLRMDFTGMGDSAAGDNERSPYYDPERRGEALAALDCLERAGFGRAVTFGLCSGADAAFQAALADERVVGVFIINLQKFIWNYGDDLRIVQRNSKRTVRSYLRSLRNPGEWRRALSGKADLAGIARVLTRRGVRRMADAVRGLFPPAPGSDVAVVRSQLQQLATRGVETLLIFSDEDPGLGEMARHFGRRARRLAGFAGARMVVLDRADHHFNGTDVRRRYRALVEAAMLDVAGRYADHAPAATDPEPPAAGRRRAGSRRADRRTAAAPTRRRA